MDFTVSPNPSSYEDFLGNAKFHRSMNRKCTLRLAIIAFFCGLITYGAMLLRREGFGEDSLYLRLIPVLVNFLCLIFFFIPKLDLKMEIHSHLADTIIDGMHLEEKIGIQKDDSTFKNFVKNFSWSPFLLREGFIISIFTITCFLSLNTLLVFIWPSLKVVWVLLSNLLGLFLSYRLASIACYPFMFVLNEKYVSEDPNRKKEKPSIKEWIETMNQAVKK